MESVLVRCCCCCTCSLVVVCILGCCFGVSAGVAAAAAGVVAAADLLPLFSTVSLVCHRSDCCYNSYLVEDTSIEGDETEPLEKRVRGEVDDTMSARSAT